MVTYIDEVTLTGGTIKDTFGPAQTINLNSKARRLLALITSGCDTVYTTAEGGVTQLSLTSSSLSISDQRFLTGPYISSGPAINASAQDSIQEIIPFDTLRSPQGNEAIALSAAPSATKTTGVSLMVGLMYCDQLPPADWRGQFPLVVPMKGGFVVDATQTTTTRTALTAMSIPTWANELIGVKATTYKYGAITAGQYEQVVFEVTSTIPDVTPMKIPSNSQGSTLGTPVGTGASDVTNPIIPVYIDLPGGTQTLTPYVNLVAAVTASNSVNFAAYWR